MRESSKFPVWKRLAFKRCWPLIGLVFIVLVFSILAFNSPVSRHPQVVTPSETDEPTTGSSVGTAEPEIVETLQEELDPPTPDEIGYTDGIIFWSTILILILLIATLREVVRRKDHQEQGPPNGA